MSDNRVCILDYGSGNIKSVFNLLNAITENVKISHKVQDIVDATHLVLPGVGAFGTVMQKINETLPMDAVTRAVIEDKKPFLGICVGMQVLATKGLEFGEHEGLGLIDGYVDKLDARGLPLPHIGWNDIRCSNPSPLLASLEDNPDFYFVHGYVFRPLDKQHVVATAVYGEAFCYVVQNENIYGVQFHPEKSQSAGITLMKNFLSLS